VRGRRLFLVTLMALCSVNIWTGAPLFAVWVGSKVQGELTTLSMGAVFIVILVLSVIVGGLTVALARLGAEYDALVGRKPGPREPAPWLRSMRGERVEHQSRHLQMSGVDRLLVVTVLLCVVAFEAWFFLLSGSSIGHG
jgi:hypothetical protein